MSLVVDLPHELEERLRYEAAREGITVEQYAQRLLENSALPVGDSSRAMRTREEWLREFNIWADAHDPNLPPFTAGGLRRENIYGEHRNGASPR